jgi:hypothetical protein
MYSSVNQNTTAGRSEVGEMNGATEKSWKTKVLDARGPKKKI